MNSIADGSVSIQTTSRSVPSTPSWFGEVALIVEHLRKPIKFLLDILPLHLAYYKEGQ